MSQSTASTTFKTTTSPRRSSSSPTATAGQTVPVATTITSSSTTCTATLQGVILDNGSTALNTDSLGTGYITLNQTCFSTTQSPTTTSTSSQTSTDQANRVTVVKTVYSSPTASTSQNAHHHHSSGLSKGTTAGIALAVISAIAVILSISGLLWCRRRRRQRSKHATVAVKTIEDDPSDDISSRWEKDGSEVKEMSSDRDPAEKESGGVQEMWSERDPIEKECSMMVCGMPVGSLSIEPVEVGDARSIRRTGSPPSPESRSRTPLSVRTEQSTGSRPEAGVQNPFDDLVSPL